MDEPDDLTILLRAGPAARSFTAFRLVLAGLLPTLGLPVLAWSLGPPTGTRLIVMIVGAVVVFVPAWSMLGAAIVRLTAARIARRDPAGLPRFDTGRWLVALTGLPGAEAGLDFHW